MDQNLRILALSHKTAPVEVREKYALGETEKEILFQGLKDIFGIREALFLSTCNRTELYYFHDQNLSAELINYLSTLSRVNSIFYSNYFDTHHGTAAIEHLFRVSMGLESKVLGDLEIYGQVKKAYQVSVDCGLADVMMHRLLHKVFYCHKSVNQNTNFKCGAASISYNAVSALLNHPKLDADSRVLVLGAGKMGTDICSHLSKKNCKNISITNRTNSKAYSLAEELEFGFVPFSRHAQELKNFDSVISSIESEEVLYGIDDFENSRVSLLIDVSSPRSIDPNVGRFGIDLLNVDDLGKVVDEVMEQRLAEVPQVEKVIEECVSEFKKWSEELGFTDQVKKFKTTLEEIRKQTLKASLKNATKQEHELVEQVTRQMIQKVIKLPVLQLKTACRRGESDVLSEALNELFNLEQKTYVKP